jgi:ornithine cyclodeaminase/alanine dehydrogenase-like protein (mu-crystallin family)
VVDSRAQCGAMGEWHHVAGDAAPTAPAELGEILRGQREGRRHDEEVIVFDSTGMAVQDACAIEVALGKIDRGRAFRFAAGHS